MSYRFDFIVCVVFGLVVGSGCGKKKDDSEKPGASPPATPAPEKGSATADPPPAKEGAATDKTDKTDKAPTLAPSAGPPHDVVELAAGYHSTMALLRNGQIRGWGQNQRGELGDGNDTIGKTRTNAIDAATPVHGKIDGVAQVVMGHSGVGNASNTTCVRKKGGSVLCWGAGALIPHSERADRGTPLEIPQLKGAKKLAVGGAHGCAVMGDGGVQCWGSKGGLGDGANKASRIPVVATGITGATDVEVAYYQSCAIVAGGAVHCWGNNGAGQVNPANKDAQPVPVAVAGIADASALGMAEKQSCAVVRGGALKCWGNPQGKRDKPPIDDVATDVVDVAGHEDHMCLLKKDGTVHCWGDNDNGQLGQGAAGKPYSSESPLQVKGLTDAVALAVGYEHTCAATKAGKVFCWGFNEFGALGDGTLLDRGAPVEVVKVNAEKLPAPDRGFSKIRNGLKTQTWENLPKGCTHSATLDAKHPALLRDAFEVKSAVARWSKDYIEVVVANYNVLNERGYDIGPRGDQVLATIYLIEVEDPKAEKEVKVKATTGTYAFKGLGQKRSVGGGSRVMSSLGGLGFFYSADKASHIELTHADDNWVCAKIAVTTPKGHWKGTLAAKVIKKYPAK